MNCFRSTTFVVSLKGPEFDQVVVEKKFLKVPASLNNFFEVERFLSLRDKKSVSPPEHVPSEIAAVFREGATCMQVECWNAAGVMFRMCLDLATRAMLPRAGEEGGPNHRQRRDLGQRLPWLFDNGYLPEALRELSTSVQQDGNDGAHQGTLTKADSEDLLDFTVALLERLYTEPERLRLAAERRAERRAPKEQ
ncbi:MAG TPA: DUF4145 domain-containing protein [Devosia sp.]|jgi:hypothetical protein|uniref:DUF4145 domain-containing protein n=1 Tax=Devosia sp. TaxID=1871048 RepID=UPI002F95B86E